MGILTIVAIDSVHIVVSVTVLYGILTLMVIGLFLSTVYNCCCCGKSKRSTQGSGRTANKRDYRGCCRDIGAALVLFLFVVVLTMLVSSFAIRPDNWISTNFPWSWVVIYGGAAMIMMAMLFLSWMAKQYRFNASSNHGTNDTIIFSSAPVFFFCWQQI